MKITERIPTKMFAYFEVEYKDLAEFQKERPKVTEVLKGFQPKPEPIPTCSICEKPMKKSKAGSWYCKHNDEWGEPVFPK